MDFLGIGQKRDWKENNHKQKCKVRQDNKKDESKSPKKYVLQNLLVKKEWNGRLVTKRKWNESKGRYLVYFCDEQNTKVWVKRENLKEDD